MNEVNSQPKTAKHKSARVKRRTKHKNENKSKKGKEASQNKSKFYKDIDIILKKLRKSVFEWSHAYALSVETLQLIRESGITEFDKVRRTPITLIGLLTLNLYR